MLLMTMSHYNLTELYTEILITITIHNIYIAILEKYIQARYLPVAFNFFRIY